MLLRDPDTAIAVITVCTVLVGALIVVYTVGIGYMLVTMIRTKGTGKMP